MNGADKTGQIGQLLSMKVWLKVLVWTLENAVGQELTGYFEEEGNQPKVIGVIKDFNYRSFNETVEPQMFHQYDNYDPYKFLVRIKEGDPTAIIAKLEKNWAMIAPNFPLKYSFLEEDINRFYRAEERYSKIVGWAGGISIFLACLGLIGLAALAAANRSKEIGIRKVLGANVTGPGSFIIQRFFKIGNNSHFDCFPNCRLYYE